MEIKDIMGYIAAILTTMAFVPQAVHTFKTRDTSGISLKMYTIFNLGLLCWLIFGILSNSLPIILANSVTLIFGLTILIMKIKHK